MAFVNSIKLFFSNWDKVLKLFLFYIVAFALTACLLIPTYIVFKDVFVEVFTDAGVKFSLSVIGANFGVNFHNFILALINCLILCFNSNAALSIYTVVVIYIILPFFLNLGKFVTCEMLYGYMSSKNKRGFFSALFKSLHKDLGYALLRSLYACVWYVGLTAAVFALGYINNVTFQTYYLVLCVFLTTVLIFTFVKVTLTAWAPSTIVFDCSVFGGFGRGLKVVSRRPAKTFFIAFCIMFFCIALCYIFYPFVILIPVIASLLCTFDMINFFTCQGMRYYINSDIILTPKRLEEVDSINKAKYIL